jgi:chromosome segregation protein
MRLKSLELTGFKSFLDQTSISFAPGITAVVGPNGCGKSNVMDAIRWVLGEQAPTRLRGKSAEDLIYAGNEHNAAAGMAEVSLTLDAEEGNALPEPYSTLSEICVTRRAYRDGESEYLLNRIPCRLKDISEFFMAAGIHSRGYALVEQGRIEEVIQAKPYELRGLIEEAAGLGLFKGRRDISERKLERVRENLARVNDVIAEIERQLNYSRRQAKKAETYRIIRDEMVGLERIVAARRLFHERASLIYHSAREAALTASAAEARIEVAALGEAANAASASLADARDRLGAASRELESIRATAADRARSRDFLIRRRDAIDQDEPRLVAQLAALDEQSRESRAARAAAGARLAREGGPGLEDEFVLNDLRQRHNSARAALRDSEKNAERLKDSLSELVREAAVIRGRLADLSGERAEIEQRLAVAPANSDNDSAESGLADTRAALEAARTALDDARATLTEIERSRSEGAERELDARTTFERAAANLKATRDVLARAERRATARAQTPVAVRLRAVLESLNGDRPATDPSALLDVIKAPVSLEPALRAALGTEIDALVVDTPYFAVRAIEILKEREAGRLSFVPAATSPVPPAEAIEAPGIAGRLLDQLEVDPRFAPTAEAILGRVMIADDVAAAIAASNLNGHGTLFVTRDGDVVSPGRMISGGSAAHSSNGRDSEDDEPQISVEDARAAVEEAVRVHAQEQTHLAEQRAGRDILDSRLGEARRTVAAAERALEDRRRTMAALEQRVALEQARRADSARRLEEIAGLIATANARLEELAHAEQAGRAALAEGAAAAANLRAAADNLGIEVLDATARIEARRASRAALEQELRHLCRRTDELEARADADSAALARARAEREEFASELATLAAQDEDSRAREAALADAVAALREECASAEAIVAERRADLASASDALDGIAREALESAIARERSSALSEELERSFTEKFDAPFDTIAAELEAALEGRDADTDDSRLAELRIRAERIGEVNLAAESEVQDLEARAAGLNAERADLESAVEDLSQTIQKLNREARRRFAETFEGAARNFSEIFPKLMRGGRGHLELETGSDMLEAGVNILVQPAGKKVREIGLLSGGEKALSAMALIFSLFLLNPSPFCVMDEVDAPLDEFSLAAFAAMVAELKERSQFIVITHNQRTMQRADQVYGVTMERPGISKVISMRIPQAA